MTAKRPDFPYRSAFIRIANLTSTCPTNVRSVSGYQYIETLGLLYPINRIVNNVTA